MGEGLEVTTASGWVRLWPYPDIRQTQGFYEGEEVRLERGGELAEAVIVSDPAFLHSLHEAAPRPSGFHDPAGRGRRVRLTVLAGVAVIGITGGALSLGRSAHRHARGPPGARGLGGEPGRAVTDQLAPPAKMCANPAGSARSTRSWPA